MLELKIKGLWAGELEFDYQQRKRFFFHPQCPDQPWDSPNHFSSEYQELRPCG
jgi:hypothetical protein